MAVAGHLNCLTHNWTNHEENLAVFMVDQTFVGIGDAVVSIARKFAYSVRLARRRLFTTQNGVCGRCYYMNGSSINATPKACVCEETVTTTYDHQNPSTERAGRHPSPLSQHHMDLRVWSHS